MPADIEVAGPESLVNRVIHAARGEGEVHHVVLRPAREFGIRFWARIGPCGPPRAALIVLADGRRPRPRRPRAPAPAAAPSLRAARGLAVRCANLANARYIGAWASIRTNAAAAMLGVSPNTLRSWERRFGFPEPRRTAGGHRQFELTEIEALRSAFEETHNISSAIALAQERGNGPASPARLRSAINRFDEAEADRVLEESLAVRSVERTVEEVLLPGVEALARPARTERRVRLRLALGDDLARRRHARRAARDPLGGRRALRRQRHLRPRLPHAQALELALRRRGLRTLTLAVTTDSDRLPTP